MQIKATRVQLRTIEISVPYRKRIGTSKISGAFPNQLKQALKSYPLSQDTVLSHGILVAL